MARPRFGAFAVPLSLTLVASLMLFDPVGSTQARAAGEADAPPDDLAPLLGPIRQKYQIPGLAAAAVRGARIVAAGAVGVREAGKDAQVQKKDDAFRPAPPPGASEPFRHVIAPAGMVSCSILDFARYASARLAGLHGKGPLLSADAYAAMARADEEDEGYTGGTGRVLNHGKEGREFSANGSGGLFLAGYRLLPDQDAAIVVAMNGVAPEALEAVVAALKERLQLPK
jgi:CubicO group peptidase (beta-lactamase class C family)